MDTDKEGTVTASAQEAIGDAAKANVNAAVEVAKSAVTAFVGALTGEPQKPKKQSTRKKAAAKGRKQEWQGEAFHWCQEICVCYRPQNYEKVCSQAAI